MIGDCVVPVGDMGGAMVPSAPSCNVMELMAVDEAPIVVSPPPPRLGRECGTLGGAAGYSPEWEAGYLIQYL